MNRNSSWQKTFAWWPVRLLNGKQAWFKYVYVRNTKTLVTVGVSGLAIRTVYEYCTILDVLADE